MYDSKAILFSFKNRKRLVVKSTNLEMLVLNFILTLAFPKSKVLFRINFKCPMDVSFQII